MAPTCGGSRACAPDETILCRRSPRRFSTPSQRCACSDYPTAALLQTLFRHADTTVASPVARTLERLAEQWKAKQKLDRAAQARVVLLIDQLEELFSSDIDKDEREAFASVCATLVNTGPIVLIATLRADVYPAFIESAAFRGLKASGQTLDVPTPDHAQITEIVTRSAEAAGLKFNDEEEGSQRRLSECLIADAEGQDALPLLQFALQRLYEEMVARIAKKDRSPATATADDLVLDIADYAKFGGLEGVLRDAAEKAFQGLDQDAQLRLPRLARALLRRAESGYTLQSAALAQFQDDPPSLKLIEALIQARILVGGDQASGVRFAHGIRSARLGPAGRYHRGRRDFLSGSCRCASGTSGLA